MNVADPLLHKAQAAIEENDIALLQQVRAEAMEQYMLYDLDLTTRNEIFAILDAHVIRQKESR